MTTFDRDERMHRTLIRAAMDDADFRAQIEGEMAPYQPAIRRVRVRRLLTSEPFLFVLLTMALLLLFAVVVAIIRVFGIWV